MLNVKATRKKRTRVRKAPAQKANRLVITAGSPTVNKKKKRNRRKRGSGVSRNDSMIRPVLSNCALQYAMAIADPWSSAALNACVPVPGGVTQRATGWIRGTSQVGTGGSFFVCCCPSIANDAYSLFYSNVGYTNVFTQAAPFTGAALNTGVTVEACANLPWSSTTILSAGNSFRSGVTGRIVSAGVRVWFSGKETNRMGTMYGFRDPNHFNTQIHPSAIACTSVAGLGTRRETQIVPFDRKGLVVCDFPAFSEEGDMSSYLKNKPSSFNDAAAQTRTIFPFSGGESIWASSVAGSSSTYAGPLGVLTGIPTITVVGVGASGETFNFEYVVHVEYGGPTTAPFGMRAPADPVGYQRVLDAASDAYVDGASTSRVGFYQKMMNALKEIQAEATPYIVPSIRKMADAYFAIHAKQAAPFPSFQSAQAGVPSEDSKDDDTEVGEDELARRGSMVVVD